MVKRFDCLKLLLSWVDEDMLTVTSRGGNAREWAHLWRRGANFHSLNMGTCLPFALGLSLAFPRRKVIAIDSDGSLLLDTSALVTLADVNPPNLLVLVFDNESYADMGPTATARGADLAKMAAAAGVKKTATITTTEEFATRVKQALGAPELALFVIKVRPGRERVRVESRLIHGRPMLENFIAALHRLPDYRGKATLSKD
ncbi:MAG TPA: thiamine pyrophosphate-dependent enzyme [Candidatus Acidoferrales bacterium]|nr:thiamine pyrophosphate-dependent enzyme [Candidatus Acidoferrales bacterium]